MSRVAQHVHFVLDLGDELVPQLDWAGWIDYLEFRDRVVFDGLDCRFCCVDAMIVPFDELDAGLLFFNKALNRARALVSNMWRLDDRLPSRK